MAARLDPALWAEIRRHWEYDPDEPSLQVAASRAAEKHSFNPPTKASIHERLKKEGWERRGTMAGVNQSAHRKADALVEADGSRAETRQPDGKPDGKPDVSGAQKRQASREESEDKRAEVLARHRQEWRQVAVLRQEALAKRTTDAADAFLRLKIAKISAETTMLQQVGERRSWGMDTPDAADVSKMTDAQLEALVKGKAA